LGIRTAAGCIRSAKGAVRATKLARNTRATGADGSSVLRVFLKSASLKRGAILIRYTIDMRKSSLIAIICLLFSASVSLWAADVPRPAPAASYKTPTGATISIADYKGKVVALEFLITTCPHCQKCSTLLQKMYNEYGARGFQPLGVATNDMAHMLVPDYVKQFGLSFPVAFAPREKAHEFLQLPLMLIMYVPQLVFIDRHGVIQAQYGGQDKFFLDEENNMRKQIEAMLGDAKKPASAKPAAVKKTSS